MPRVAVFWLFFFSFVTETMGRVSSIYDDTSNVQTHRWNRMRNGWHSADDYWTRKNQRRATVNGIDIGTGMVYIHLIQNMSTHISKIICTTIEFLLKRNNINGTNGTVLADWEKANEWANEMKTAEKTQHRADIVKAYRQNVHVPYTLCIIRNNINVDDALVVFSYKRYIFFILCLGLTLFFLSMRCRFSTFVDFLSLCVLYCITHVYMYLSICLSIYLYLAG